MCLRCCCPYLGYYYPDPHTQRKSAARSGTAKDISAESSPAQHRNPRYTNKPKKNTTAEGVSLGKTVPKPPTIVGGSSFPQQNNPRAKNKHTKQRDTTVSKVSSSQARNLSHTHKHSRKSSAEGVSPGKPIPNPRRAHKNTGKDSTAERFTSRETVPKVSAATSSSPPEKSNPRWRTQENMKQNVAAEIISGEKMSVPPAYIQDPSPRQAMPSTTAGASPLRQANHVTSEESDTRGAMPETSATAENPPLQRNNPSHTHKCTNAAEGSADSFYEQITEFIYSMHLDKFYSQHDSYLRELCEKAADLVKDETAILNKPKDVSDMTKVALYDTIVYCDDSGSMQHGNGERIKALQELVRRVTKITTMLDTRGIKVRFINFDGDGQFNDIRTQSAVEEIESLMQFKGRHTKIGTNLEEKILDPLLFEKIRAESLERPLLITTITDGEPTWEDKGHFRDTIHKCLGILEEHGYNTKSAIFQVSQVGNSPEATAFIKGLNDDQEIGHMIYCTSGSVDQKLAELRDNERDLERWLLDLLLQGLDGPMKV